MILRKYIKEEKEEERKRRKWKNNKNESKASNKCLSVNHNWMEQASEHCVLGAMYCLIHFFMISHFAIFFDSPFVYHCWLNKCIYLLWVICTYECVEVAEEEKGGSGRQQLCTLTLMSTTDSSWVNVVKQFDLKYYDYKQKRWVLHLSKKLYTSNNNKGWISYLNYVSHKKMNSKELIKSSCDKVWHVWKIK